MPKTNDVLGLLGLASRARKVVSGEPVLKSIRLKQAQLVILAKDASENTKKKYRDKCDFYERELIEFSDIDTISKAIGMSNRVCIAIVDEGFARTIKSKLGG
jgi:ribosomal protein L7Ae-like RNA K-turn-binding protein